MAFSITDGSKAYTRSSTEGDVLTGTFWVRQIDWLPAADGNTLVVDDGDDEIVAEGAAFTENLTPVFFEVNGLVTDLTLRTLDGASSVIVRLISTPQTNYHR